MNCTLADLISGEYIKEDIKFKLKLEFQRPEALEKSEIRVGFNMSNIQIVLADQTLINLSEESFGACYKTNKTISKTRKEFEKKSFRFKNTSFNLL